VALIIDVVQLIQGVAAREGQGRGKASAAVPALA
jgi:hypothetical protein